MSIVNVPHIAGCFHHAPLSAFPHNSVLAMSLLWCCSHPPHISRSISLSTTALLLNHLVWRRNIFLPSAQCFFCRVLLELLLTWKLYSVYYVLYIELDNKLFEKCLVRVILFNSQLSDISVCVFWSFSQKVLKVQSMRCISFHGQAYCFV